MQIESGQTPARGGLCPHRQKQKMRVGVLPYASGTIDGAFHYEIVFLNALSEIAPRFPEEFVCLTSPENNLSSLARTGDLKYRGVPVCPLHQKS